MAGSIGQPTIGWLPWQAEYAKSGSYARSNQSTAIGMGVYFSDPGATTDYLEYQFWLDSGTWKFAMLYNNYTTRAIATVTVDGVSVGTIDMYSTAPSVYNNYAEFSFAVATPGLKTIRIATPTKNASSTGYSSYYQSFALIKTAGAHSTGSGGDTPGYTWQFLPWMGSKANTNFDNRVQSSTVLGGQLQSTGVQNAASSWDIWLDAGTYKFALIRTKNDDEGIATVQLDGVSQGTLDGYNAGAVLNFYQEITGIAVASAGVKTLNIVMATKHASATAYYGRFHSLAWIRTA